MIDLHWPRRHTGKKYHLGIFVDQDTEDSDESPHTPIGCPLLITTKNDFSLLQPAKVGSELDTISPIITLEDPLKQTFDFEAIATRPSFTASQTNRMSLQTIIPELGVLLIGSPSGRVAVFSLLRTDDWAARKKGTYFVRLDWHLPLQSQEKAGLRPDRKLLGMAAGPVQGQFGHVKPHKRRKWRLMLYYADHSILSYELSLPD